MTAVVHLKNASDTGDIPGCNALAAMKLPDHKTTASNAKRIPYKYSLSPA